MAVNAIAVGILAAGGVIFTLVAVVGVLRLPDLYTRTHAVSKADTLGAGLSVGAAIVASGTPRDALKLALLLGLLLVTNPTAAHALARAGRRTGVPEWTAADRESGGEDDESNVGGEDQ